MSLRSHEVTSVREFEALQEAGIGWIINVDQPTKTNTAHRAACDEITVTTFTQKVIDGGGASGCYMHFLRLEDAERELEVRRCGRCS